MSRVVVINLCCKLAAKFRVALATQREKMADQLPTLLRGQRCGLRFDLLEAHECRVIKTTPHAISGSLRAVYSRMLEKMRLDRWQVFDRRYSLGKFTKLWLVLRGWLGALG
jgi:hypothetical protein